MNFIRKTYCRIFQKAFHMVIPLLPYREPEIISRMQDIPDVILKEKSRKPILITDEGISRLGLTNELRNVLEERQIPYVYYDKTSPNPTTKNVQEALDLYSQNECDLIIGFGGGSSMDCAKALGARVARPNKSLAQMKGILKIHKKIPTLIAIPTTAGTGSETTLAAVIKDSETKHKYAISDFPLIPKYAVLDPSVTISLPPHITATTGMDALTHAVEAYIGNSTTKDTRAESIKAVRLIFENLEKAYLDGKNLEARKNMLTASYYAGCAFTKSYVGNAHAVAHTLGGEYNVPHGLANAVLLPNVLEAYGKKIHKKLARLAEEAGLKQRLAETMGKEPQDMTREDLARSFILEIKELKKKFGIGDIIPELEKEDIPKLSRYADKEANPLYPVPVMWNAKELQMFYEQILEKQSYSIEELVEKQRAFFYQGKTLDLEFRRKALQKLKEALLRYEYEIAEALKKDLGKSHSESYMCEIGLVASEITYMLKHMRAFAREKRVKTPLAQFASRSYKKPSPYGVTLIMSPWNYPLLLTLDPLVDALAAGNTAVVKPSAYSPCTSEVINRMIGEIFDPEYVAVVTGGRAENTKLLDQKFDYIFFTGSLNVGKEVMRKASVHLTPVTLELGGKSPCIIEKSADIKLAAKRIVFGKYLNCGQTCVAPDYIYCDPSVKEPLIQELKKQIQIQYGKEPLENPNYGKIVNEKHFGRLLGLIDQEKVVCGGKNSPETLQIEPTIMDQVEFTDAAMQEEIFGPILPILTYESIDQAMQHINDGGHPLALYLFTSDKKICKKVMAGCGFGGGCVNDVVIHLATSEMGFGGFGESGMGSYHGKDGFQTFSHEKSIVDKKTWIDLPMRYQPYTKLHDRMIRMFVK